MGPGHGVNDPLGNVRGVIADTLVVLGDHQQVQGVFAVCRVCRDLSDQALLDPGKLLVHNIIRRDDLFRQHYITFHIGVHTFRHHLYDSLCHFLQKGVVFRLPPV